MYVPVAILLSALISLACPMQRYGRRATVLDRPCIAYRILLLFQRYTAWYRRPIAVRHTKTTTHVANPSHTWRLQVSVNRLPCTHVFLMCVVRTIVVVKSTRRQEETRLVKNSGHASIVVSSLTTADSDACREQLHSLLAYCGTPRPSIRHSRSGWRLIDVVITQCDRKYTLWY